MNEQEMKQIMYKAVAATCQQLELHEIAALYMNTILNNNTGIEQIIGYDKISHLFKDGKMHNETREAFLAYCQKRLNS